jgi:hypothetical protein
MLPSLLSQVEEESDVYLILSDMVLDLRQLNAIIFCR